MTQKKKKNSFFSNSTGQVSRSLGQFPSMWSIRGPHWWELQSSTSDLQVCPGSGRHPRHLEGEKNMEVVMSKAWKWHRLFLLIFYWLELSHLVNT